MILKLFEVIKPLANFTSKNLIQILVSDVISLMCHTWNILHYKVLMVPGFSKSVVGVVCDIPHYKIPGSWFQ